MGIARTIILTNSHLDKSTLILFGIRPQVTLFKTVFKRLYYYNKKTIAQNFIGNIDFGQKITCVLSKHGDLISNMILDISLPELAVGENVSYINNIAYFIIDYIELEINGKSIIKYPGEWLYIYDQLTNPSFTDLYQLIGYNRSDINIPISNPNMIKPTKNVMLPLKFWFCNNPEYALPVISSYYSDIKININLATLSNITTGTGLGDTKVKVASGSKLDVKLYTDYIFLESDEKKLFLNNVNSYLIEQVQYFEPLIYSNNYNIEVPLNKYNHLVKEIVVVTKLENSTVPYNFTNNESNELSTDSIVDNMQFILNGYEYSTYSADWYNKVIPYKYHTNSVNMGIYNYSFSIYPEQIQPTGTLNFSKIEQGTIKIKLNTLESIKVYVYMINYNYCIFDKGIFSLRFS